MSARAIRMVRWAAPVIFLSAPVAGCGGGTKPDAAPATGSGTPQPAAAPSAGAVTPGAPPNAGGSTKAPSGGAGAATPRAADATGRMAAGGAKAPGDSVPLHDSAFGPKFTMDSTGKIVPVKKPKD